MLVEAFYERKKDEMIDILSRFSGDREAAADAVQEAFLKALNRRALLSGMEEKTLWAWLYSTAKNVLTDEKRKASRMELWDSFDGSAGTGPAEITDPADTILARDLLYKLPPRLIPIVSLRYFGGLNATEIGVMKGIPAATVRSQLRAAIEILRQHVSKNDF